MMVGQVRCLSTLMEASALTVTQTLTQKTQSTMTGYFSAQDTVQHNQRNHADKQQVGQKRKVVCVRMVFLAGSSRSKVTKAAASAFTATKTRKTGKYQGLNYSHGDVIQTVQLREKKTRELSKGGDSYLYHSTEVNGEKELIK